MTLKLLHMEFTSLHAPIAFTVCFLDFPRYYGNVIIFLNESTLYFNDKRLAKISLSFIVISNEIVHPLVLLEPDFENSGILDCISKMKNYQNNLERSKIRNIESKYAPPNDVTFQSATKPVFVRRLVSSVKVKIDLFRAKKLIFRFFEWILFAKLKKSTDLYR